MAVHSISDETREHLVTKLLAMLPRDDNTSITRQQKIKLFKLSIYPRLTWDLSISDLPVSRLQNTLQPIATRYVTEKMGWPVQVS